MSVSVITHASKRFHTCVPVIQRQYQMFQCHLSTSFVRPYRCPFPYISTYTLLCSEMCSTCSWVTPPSTATKKSFTQPQRTKCSRSPGNRPSHLSRGQTPHRLSQTLSLKRKLWLCDVRSSDQLKDVLKWQNDRRSSRTKEHRNSTI